LASRRESEGLCTISWLWSLTTDSSRSIPVTCHYQININNSNINYITPFIFVTVCFTVLLIIRRVLASVILIGPLLSFSSTLTSLVPPQYTKRQRDFESFLQLESPSAKNTPMEPIPFRNGHLHSSASVIFRVPDLNMSGHHTLFTISPDPCMPFSSGSRAFSPLISKNG
jgi:hypothetical protein